jgi:hypothetical protein
MIKITIYAKLLGLTGIMEAGTESLTGSLEK